MYMKRSSGFTLIELLITISIMVILMTLAVVSIRSTQVNARDDERTTDIENLARGLERRYNEGNSRVIGWTSQGSYPGYNEFLHATGSSFWCSPDPGYFSPCSVSGGYMTDFWPGTTKDAFTAPNGTFNSVKTQSDVAGAVTKATLIAGGNYFYEPLTNTGATCSSGGCTHYNLYYQRESDSTTQTKKSKNQ